MKPITTLFIFFTSVIILQAQNSKPLREAFTLTLKVDGTDYYQQEIEETPYFVKESILQIYPGEKLNIEVEIENDSIVSMTTVKKNLHPKKTIVVHFHQIEGKKTDTDMILNVKNPFNKTLRHKALMFTTNSNELQPTSIIPIRPTLENFETWGYPIISLILVEWELTDE